jgi:hypothetical protein
MHEHPGLIFDLPPKASPVLGIGLGYNEGNSE